MSLLFFESSLNESFCWMVFWYESIEKICWISLTKTCLFFVSQKWRKTRTLWKYSKHTRTRTKILCNDLSWGRYRTRTIVLLSSLYHFEHTLLIKKWKKYSFWSCVYSPNMSNCFLGHQEDDSLWCYSRGCTSCRYDTTKRGFWLFTSTTCRKKWR